MLSMLTIIMAALSAQPSLLYEEPATTVFESDRGVTIDPGIASEQGFALDFEVLFHDVDREHRILQQEGLFLLRMDPPSEGCGLSFFVNVAGQVEPRLRTVAVKRNTWYRVTASWDGAGMWMRVDGETFRANRVGAPEGLGAPLDVGGTGPRGAAGLRGMMRNLRVYGAPMTEVESMLSGANPAKAVAGWYGAGATPKAFEGGLVRADITEAMGVLATDAGPAGPTAGFTEGDYITVRMAVDGGDEAKLYAQTTAGKREIMFPLVRDGRMHSYVVPMDRYPEWRGELETLALAFPGTARQARIAFMRSSDEPDGPPECLVTQCYADPPYLRAGRDFTLVARVKNVGGAGPLFASEPRLPEGVTSRGEERVETPGVTLKHGETIEVRFLARAEQPLKTVLGVAFTAPGMTETLAETRVVIHKARAVEDADYVPAPKPVETKRLVGAHYCPLWKEGARSGGWGQIEPYPLREPLLGWYDEHNPEVTDWEVKWALDHGINFFVYCWYRDGQSEEIKPFLGHAIHDGLFQSRYGDQFHFAIMWENQFKGHWGANSKEDLLDNLFPFWMENYFKKPNYLVIDNKPVLFIYRTERVVEDLGSEEAVREAFAAMRQQCIDAGFNGLYILGEDRGKWAANLEQMARVNMDASFCYCWPIGGDPDDAEATAAQEAYWKVRRDMDILPDVLTVSMGWDSTPWHESLTKWHMSPEGFEAVCRKADAFMDTLPDDSLASKFLLLDNWNEFGEGHYIAPHRELGFGYLDAVRAAFSDAPETHEDVVPQDLGLGPYEMLYEAAKQYEAETRQRHFAEGGDAPGLVGWWTFDEEDGNGFAWDYSGHTLGGRLKDAKRAPGFRGKALVCDGGSVRVATDPLMAPRKGITFTLWLKTDTPDQTDRWFINRIHGGRESSGYRFGLDNGRLCWAVPQRQWSHHLHVEEPLPLGRWVHVAATSDRETIKVYMDGKLVGSMDRYGVVKENGQPLVIGNYDVGHRAYYEGLLDEVRLYDYAMTADEIRKEMDASRAAAK